MVLSVLLIVSWAFLADAVIFCVVAIGRDGICVASVFILVLVFVVVVVVVVIACGCLANGCNGAVSAVTAAGFAVSIAVVAVLLVPGDGKVFNLVDQHNVFLASLISDSVSGRSLVSNKRDDLGKKKHG